MAVVATLSKGYDLDYIWKQVDRGPAKDAASYYIQASESGGEPPGRWWGPGAKALGFEPGQTVEREPYDLLFGERKAPDGTPLGRPPDGGRKAADLYAQLLAAEPHATAERKRELRIEAARQARQSPLFFDLTMSLSKSISIFHASLGENARLARQAGDHDGDAVLVRPGRRGRRHDLAGRARRVRLLPARGRLHPHRLPQHPGPRPGDRPVARGRPGGGALAAAHLPGRRHAAARPLPDRPRRQDRRPTGNGGPRTPWATTSTSARSPRSSPSTWKKPSPHRFGLEWTARDDGHGFEIKGISGEMMRVFSSRRESITADLRGRAARFEQRYGRAPSQRELAQLAQASNFTHAQRQARRAGSRAAHAGWADKLARTLGVSLASVAPSVWHGAAGRAAAHARGADQPRLLPELELARAAQKAVALAQQEKSTWTRADLIKYLGRVLPRTGLDPAAAAALLEDLADRALRSEFEPVTCLEAPEPAEVPRSLLRADGRSVYQRHGGIRYATRAQLVMEERMLAQARADGAPRLTRAQAAHALGADPAQLEAALTGTRRRRRRTRARAPGCARTRPPPRCRS